MTLIIDSGVKFLPEVMNHSQYYDHIQAALFDLPNVHRHLIYTRMLGVILHL